MSEPLFTASQYVRHLVSAKGPHSLHSPFLYDLFNKVIKPSGRLLSDVELKRKELLKDDRVIDVVDFKTGTAHRSTVREIARRSLGRPKFSNFLRLLCEYMQIERVLETGTSLGINALYLSKAGTVQKVVSIEGSEAIHQIARKVIGDNQKVRLEHGKLTDILEMNLVRDRPELVFLDADHRSSALDFCLDRILHHIPKVHCIVVHDINWSKDMRDWWDEIVEDSRFALTMDIFQAGLIFPTYPIEKQHFTLKF